MKNKFEIRGDKTIIFLNRKNGDILEAVIDTEDLDKVASFPNTWYSIYNKGTKSFYARGEINRKAIFMHRLVTDAPEGTVPDHLNHDTLDNTKSNLRVITQAENMQNRSSSSASSGERGVTWVPHCKKWRVRIRHKGKEYYGGLFESKEEAVEQARQLRSEILPYSMN